MPSQSLTTFLTESIAKLKEQGLYNTIEPLEGPNGPTIRLKGSELINLSSNNYLGLATDSRLIEAANEATKRFGAGSGAVRTINGTLSVHAQLEEKLAAFKQTEAAVVFQSGFNCNMAAISAVMGPGDAILSDELNHASIIDGCRLARSKVIRYNHSDMDDLRAKAKEAREAGIYGKIMVITDGVFSMDGDIAKLPDIVEIAESFDLITYVDDAHGSGVLGGGAGTVKHFGLADRVDFQIGTLSKAVGAAGGYVAGSRALIDWLKLRGRPFLFSTSLPAGVIGACLAAVDIIQSSGELQEKLWSNAAYLQEGLKSLGYTIGSTQTPITPCFIGDEATTQRFSSMLYEEGVYAKAIVFPTVPKGTGRIRNMPTAAHTRTMLDQALHAYANVGRKLNLIQ